MADTLSMALAELLRKADAEPDLDTLREGVRVMTQALMELEVAQHLGAERYQRSPERQGERNGYRDRNWDTRVGTLELRVPRVRDGSFFPGLLEPRKRAERALGSSSGGHQILLTALRPRDGRYTHLSFPDRADLDARLSFVLACWPIAHPLECYRQARNLNLDGVAAYEAYWPSEAAMSEGNPHLVVERRRSETDRLNKDLSDPVAVVCVPGITERAGYMGLFNSPDARVRAIGPSISIG